MTSFTKTLKVRVRDKHIPLLQQMARDVNFVWNYLNDLSHRSIRERGVFLSGYDMDKYTAGASKDLSIGSASIQQISAEYTTRRRQFKKTKLRWRKTFGSKRSLGWIPAKKGQTKWKNGQVFFAGHHFKVWDSYGLNQYEFRSASFNEDARGRWYFNVVVKVPQQLSHGTGAVGIDLGNKTAATMSDGTQLSGRWYRAAESKLAVAQRSGNKRRTRAIHAKVANQRKDALHKLSRRLVDQSAAIFVGNVSSKAMAKTNMAKGSLDAGWGMLKNILRYKCDHAGVFFDEVPEAYTTQACSCCGSIPASSPKGRAGLVIREWICSDCGATHDRDINAARNILALGHERLVGGISVL